MPTGAARPGFSIGEVPGGLDHIFPDYPLNRLLVQWLVMVFATADPRYLAITAESLIHAEANR